MVGAVFFLAMVAMAATAAYLAYLKSQPSNIFGGALTIYLVATSWMAARRKGGETGVVEIVAFLVALAANLGILVIGLQAWNSPNGVPAARRFRSAAYRRCTL